MYNSISMTRMASSIAYAMGAEAPRQADPAIPLVTDMVDEVLNGGKADRVLIYNPDCIGLWMYQKYTEDLAPVLHATQLALPIATVAPSWTPVCFGSMYTGVSPDVHGIKGYVKPVITVDSLFDSLPRSGKKVALVTVAKSSMAMVYLNREIDYYIEEYDDAVTEKALELIQKDQYDLIVVYNQEYDDMIHRTQPESPEAMAAFHHHIDAFDRLTKCVKANWADHDGMGMVASYRMMEALIEKAKKYGMAGGAIRNSTHYGIAGYWTTMATKAGMIGVTGTNARPSIAPTFGVENMMGTNPLTWAIPTDEEFPFCIDCATSVVQRGKIEYYAREGKDTPAGMVISHDGSSMTDSSAILKALVDGTAALTPLGGAGDEMCGYKGYGYAAVVEILSAALTGGPFMKALTGVDQNGNPQMYHLGHFFFVINPEFFMGLDTCKKTGWNICRALRASEIAPGHDRIYTAGEKEWLAWCERKDKGVPIGEAVQREMIAVRDQLKLPYHFDFEAAI